LAADPLIEELPALAASKDPIYTKGALDRELRQAEIISDLSQYVFDTQTKEVEAIDRAFSIILTQDCDLLWDFESRNSGGNKTLVSVLMFAAERTSVVKPQLGGSDIWKRIFQNKDKRYHLLEDVPPTNDVPSVGIECLIIDFKIFFTLTPADIYSQCAAGTAKRRCRLEVPYREHLQCRAAFYFQRVMLPEPHKYAAPTAKAGA
jgi:hypothetical protein